MGSSSLTAPRDRQFAERRAGRDVEGERVGVHFVILAVGQRRLEVDHREAGQQARFLLRLEALFDRGNEFLGDRAADHFILEHKAGARRQRFEFDRDFGELARTAGLLLVGVFDGDRLGERFAISHLRRADIGVHLVGALEDIDLDLQMQFAHALEDGLAGFLIGGNAEGRIFLGQAHQRHAHLFLVGLGLGLDRHFDDRIGEFHPLQDHRIVGIAQRLAGGGELEAGKGDDVAGIGFLDVFAAVGMHQKHAADALGLVLDRIERAGARSDGAGIDAHEGDRADKGIVHDLEGQAGERRLVVGGTLDFIALEVGALDRRNVERRRQIIDHGIEQRLHALVLEGRAAHHRHEMERRSRPCGCSA